MKSAESASEHLRTIRNLMERATVYRAISGPAALVGGTLTMIVGVVLLSMETTWKPGNLQFAGIWFAVLAVVTAVNFYLLARGARDRGEPFVSAGMKHALLAISPALLAGGVLSLMVATNGEKAATGCKAQMTALWTMCYGLSMLAAGSFAPKSMRILGAAFFVLGLALFQPALTASSAQDYGLALRSMIACFGLLHLLYGAWVLLSSKRAPSVD